jgi:hypothetical protein
MSQSASYIYSRCPQYLSSECVTYQGLPIECLNICTGQTLTQVESSIAHSLCTLIGETDMNSVKIPECLQTLWGTTEPTIKSIFALLLEDACNQQAAISSIQNQIDTIDPLVTVDYKCCSKNSCVTTGEVKLSVALQNILNCLCDLNRQMQNFDDQIATINRQITSLTQQMNGVIGFVNTQSATNSTFADAIGSSNCRITAIINSLSSASSFPINVVTTNC